MKDFDDMKNQPNVLHLTLDHISFERILNENTKIEHREVKPYWTYKLYNETFDLVRFVNGSGPKRPFMVLECIKILQEGSLYEIHLGKIINSGNSPY